MDTLLEKLSAKFSKHEKEETPAKEKSENKGGGLKAWLEKRKNPKHEAGESKKEEKKEDKGGKEDCEEAEKCSSLIEKLAAKSSMAKTIADGKGATEKHIKAVAKRSIEKGEDRGTPLVKK